jgi:glycolate oxidase FAD binding subunit
LPKLYVGSLGTLGLIVEATFRLYSIPEISKTFLLSCPALDTYKEMALSLLNSSVTPTSLEVLNPPLLSAISDKLNLNLKHDMYAIAVRLEGIEKAVREQTLELKRILGKKNGEVVLLESYLEENLWEEIREFPWRISGDNRTVCKASVLITDVEILLQASEELARESGLKIYLSGQGGTGVIITAFEGKISSTVEAIKSLRALVYSLKGALVIKEAAPSVKSQVDVWGEIGTSLRVMERMKSLFDPDCILNPGRFIG